MIKHTTKGQSRQLKELGVLQVSDWYYNQESPDLLHWLFRPEVPESAYAAYDATDLGIMLPVKIIEDNTEHILHMTRDHHGVWFIFYKSGNDSVPRAMAHAENEAIARCNMLTMLIKTGYIDVKDVNERYKQFIKHA